MNALGETITIGSPTMSSSSSFSTSFSSEMSGGSGNTAMQTQKQTQFAYVFPAEGIKGNANVSDNDITSYQSSYHIVS